MSDSKVPYFHVDAFTARALGGNQAAVMMLEAWPDEGLNPAFAAVIQCVDEAVLNAMVANEAMTGRDGHHVPALPHAPVEAWCRALRAGPPPA